MFSRVCILRENVDLGWAMVGLETQEPPTEKLRPYVQKVVDALSDLHNREQEIAFKLLGYDGDGALESMSIGSPVNLDHLEIPQMSQIVGSQLQLDWTQIDVSPDAVSGERERRLLCEHIKMPAPVVMENGCNKWHRVTPRHLQLRLGHGSGTGSSSVRLLNFDNGGQSAYEEMAAVLEGPVQHENVDDSVGVAAIRHVDAREGGATNEDSSPGVAVVHGTTIEEFHTSSR